MLIYEAACIEAVGIMNASRRFDISNESAPLRDALIRREFSIPFPSRRRRLIDLLANNKDASRRARDQSGVVDR